MSVNMLTEEGQIKNNIRHLWYLLTDDEVDALEDRKDIFFLAVRKKHGLVRAQAEIMLNEMKQQIDLAA